MKILFFGLGSIGTRHKAIIQALYEYQCDSFRDYGRDWRRVGKYDVAFVCNPTYLHIKTAIGCANRGMHIFLEKPIGCSTEKLQDLLDAVSRNGLTCYVAYPFRHHPMIQYLKSTNLPDEGEFKCTTNFVNWRNYENYSYHREQGGDVLLELSHEIDLAVHFWGKITWMGGATHRCFNSPGDGLTAARIRVRHERGTSFHNLDTYNNYEDRQFMLGDKWYVLDKPEDMWVNQIRYFFDNLDNPWLMNNIFEAAETFEKLMEFRDREYSRYDTRA